MASLAGSLKGALIGEALIALEWVSVEGTVVGRGSYTNFGVVRVF